MILGGDYVLRGDHHGQYIHIFKVAEPQAWIDKGLHQIDLIELVGWMAKSFGLIIPHRKDRLYYGPFEISRLYFSVVTNKVSMSRTFLYAYPDVGQAELIQCQPVCTLATEICKQYFNPENTQILNTFIRFLNSDFADPGKEIEWIKGRDVLAARRLSVIIVALYLYKRLGPNFWIELSPTIGYNGPPDWKSEIKLSTIVKRVGQFENWPLMR